LQTEDKQKYKQENFSVALAVQNIEKNRYVSVLARKSLLLLIAPRFANN
jgi:hypothetical protein